MISLNSIKFAGAILSASVIFTSCGFWRAAKPEAAPTAGAPTSASDDDLKSGVPFATKEPEIFQAEFVVRTGGDSDNKIFVACAGNRQRYDYNLDAKNRFTVLRTAANESVLIVPNEKLYATNSVSAPAAAGQTAGNFKDFLTNEWLNQKPDAKFTKLDAENNLTKYAVRLDDSDFAEAVIFVDEQINLPVRQEFYSTKGDRKILNYTVEMKNFKQQADDDLFEIPKDYKKVSLEELKTAMQKEGFSEE